MFISVGGLKKNTDLQEEMEHFRLFCSHSVLPTEITYGNLFFWSPIAVGLSNMSKRLGGIMVGCKDCLYFYHFCFCFCFHALVGACSR